MMARIWVGISVGWMVPAVLGLLAGNYAAVVACVGAAFSAFQCALLWKGAP